MPLIIPSKTINDSFNLSDFQNDFNFLSNTKWNTDGSSIYNLGSSGSSYPSYWVKVCDTTLLGQYNHAEVKFELFGGAQGNYNYPRATIEARVKQQTALGTNPIINLEISNASVVGAVNFKAVTTVTGTSSKVEIYVQFVATYENYYVSPTFNYGQNGAWVFYNNSALISTIPTGTFQTTCVQKFATNFNTNGYKVLDGGLIIQWGYAYFPNNRTGDFENIVTFPIAFPSVVYNIQVNLVENDVEYHNSEITSVKDNFSTSQFNYRSHQTNGAYSGKIFWSAIGC